MWQGFKDVWGCHTTSGLIAGVVLALGGFDLFKGDYGWAAVNIGTGIPLYLLSQFRELRP